MASRNKSKLVIGLILVIIAFVCAVGVLYFMGQKQEDAHQRIASLEVELANIIADQSEPVIRETDLGWVKREPVKLEDYISKAEGLYGDSELLRNEGVLWVDHKSGHFIVTLGAVNALKQGSFLDVYQGDEIIEQIVVDTALDIISYVTPVSKTVDDFDKSYYKVVVSQSASGS